MKLPLLAVAGLAVALAGCSQTVDQAIERLNAALQRGAPAACKQASTAYQTWLASAPSDKALAKVNKYYTLIHDACVSPSTITVEEAAMIGAQWIAMQKALKGK